MTLNDGQNSNQNGIEIADQADAQLMTFAIMIASGNTREAISKEMGVSLRTLDRWRQTPFVRSQVNVIFSQTREAAISRIRILASKAVGQLEAIADDEKTPPKVRAEILFRMLDLSITLPSFDGGEINPDEIVRQDLARAALSTVWE